MTRKPSAPSARSVTTRKREAMNGDFIYESTDSTETYPLYEVNIGAITALTTGEVNAILNLLKDWGYQWDGEHVCLPFLGNPSDDE